jgi:hypothetical protein
MTSEPIRIRDLLYLDFDKAASIWSQLESGLPERVSVTDEKGRNQAAGAKFGIPGVARADLNADYIDKTSTLVSRTLHHDVLSRIEERLQAAGLVADLRESVAPEESSPIAVREAIGEHPYLRATGSSVVEDYRRILAITQKFNDVTAFLAKINEENTKKSDEYKALQKLISDALDAANSLKDRNKKATQRQTAKQLERQLDELTKAKVSGVDDWLVDGIGLWINTFMANRINFRLYPFPDCPSFQVLCNLKRDCFVDTDLEHVLYGYGNRPNVPLTVFGLVTSLPTEDDSSFDPMKEFETETAVSDKIKFEKGFRDLFTGMEGIESFVRYSRYPNVTVHPIAVYRSFSASGKAV